MGEAKRRGSYLERMIAAQERNARAFAELDAKRKSFALEVKAQSERIGMSLAPTNLIAQSKSGRAPGTEPARVVIIGLDQLVQRLAAMERAVDDHCPDSGKKVDCDCVACQIRKAAGMLFRVEPTSDAEPVARSGYANTQGQQFDSPVYSGPGGQGPIADPLPNPSETAAAIIASERPDISAHVALHPEYEPGDCEDAPDDCETCEHERCAGCEPDPDPESDTEKHEVPNGQ
jgi:hypothetical protein